MNVKSQDDPNSAYYGSWIYVGPGGTKGLRHRVLWVESYEDPWAGFTYTWSQPKGPSSGGESWMGSWSDFLKEFKRA